MSDQLKVSKMVGKSKQFKRKNIDQNDIGSIKVAVNGSGEGLPYAPVDWPEPGDIWRWRVGSRISVDGHFSDRYLNMPTRLHSTYVSKLRRFTSKRTLKEFITANFPTADADKVLSSFCWKIPAEKEMPNKKDSDAEPSSQIARCKAGNRRCISLVEIMSPSRGEAKICNQCCRENTFCRDCSCTLCFRTINDEGILDYIRCEAAVGENLVCGHIVHVRCALKSFMAGKVGGSIALDAESLCRPCNSKTDLIPHVEKLLKACQSSSSKEAVQKWLMMCRCILNGSMRTKSKELMDFVLPTIRKLNNGMSLEDVRNAQEMMPPPAVVAVIDTDKFSRDRKQEYSDEFYEEFEKYVSSSTRGGDRRGNDILVEDDMKRKNQVEEEQADPSKEKFEVGRYLIAWGPNKNRLGEVNEQGDISASARPSQKALEASAIEKGISSGKDKNIIIID